MQNVKPEISFVSCKHMPMTQCFSISGMLSKSRGQILRVAAVLHVLFHIDTPQAIPKDISENALQAALDFVEVCNQHAAFLAGKGLISDAIEALQDLQNGM